jgi:prophage regulatory protein
MTNDQKKTELAPPPGRVVINRKQLLQKVPLSERTILDMEKRGAFPRRFSISPRLVVWDNAEVDAWIAGQQAAAIQQPPPGATTPRQ